jgi:hypothetical protein
MYDLSNDAQKHTSKSCETIHLTYVLLYTIPTSYIAEVTIL